MNPQEFQEFQELQSFKDLLDYKQIPGMLFSRNFNRSNTPHTPLQINVYVPGHTLQISYLSSGYRVTDYSGIS